MFQAMVSTGAWLIGVGGFLGGVKARKTIPGIVWMFMWFVVATVAAIQR